VSRAASPTAIGAFVIGAIALVVAGLVVFGSGTLFQDTTTYALYFEDSVTGLSPGAPVVFRGVEVGQVVDIKGTVDENLDIDIPVIVRIGGSRIERRGSSGDARADREELIRTLIGRGLRGQLGLQSLVTGQLLVTLDFFPDKQAVYRGDGSLPEIPTVPSPLTEIQQRVQDLPLQEIAREMLVVLQSIDHFVSSEELRRAVTNLDRALVSARRLAENLDKEIGPLAQSADDALSTLSDDSPTRYALDEALVEVGAAARSIRILAEYLERHPESLLAGKGGKE
jgi:paraquat-inducible protein B